MSEVGSRLTGDRMNVNVNVNVKGERVMVNECSDRVSKSQ